MNAADVQTRQLQLFDGAMTVELPAAFQDLSLLRPVPDHQEVYINREAEQSVIAEVMEYQQNVLNEEAGRFFFFDLMKENRATDAELTSTRLVAGDPQIPVSMQQVVRRAVLLTRIQQQPVYCSRTTGRLLDFIHTRGGMAPSQAEALLPLPAEDSGFPLKGIVKVEYSSLLSAFPSIKRMFYFHHTASQGLAMMPKTLSLPMP